LVQRFQTYIAPEVVVRRQAPVRKAQTVTLPRVDPERWAALCAGLRVELEGRLVAVGETLTASDLTLRDGEEQAEREYLLALDAYAAAGKLLDDAQDPPEFGGVAALIDIAAVHFAVALARHEGRAVPHPRHPCFYNPLHGPANPALDMQRKPKKKQRQASPQNRAADVPLCPECRVRVKTNQPLDYLATAVSVKTGRRSEALVAIPYFLVAREKSIWAATGYGSLPGSSDADLVRRVLAGDYRKAKAAPGKARRGLLGGRRG
jgi:hypothetical protein